MGGIVLSFSSAVSLYIPQLFSKLEIRELSRELPHLAVLLLAVLIIRGISVSLHSYLFALAGERLKLFLQNSLFQQLQRKKVYFFRSKLSGEVLSSFISDVEIIKAALSMSIISLIKGVIISFGSLILLLYTIPSFAPWILSAVIIFFIALQFVGRKYYQLAYKLQNKRAALLQHLKEFYSGIVSVKTLSLEEKFSQIFSKTSEEVFKISIKMKIWGILYPFFLLTAFSILLFSLLWVGSRQLEEGQLTAGQILTAMAYLLGLGAALREISNQWQPLKFAQAALNRIGQVFQISNLDLEKRRKESPQPRAEDRSSRKKKTDAKPRHRGKKGSRRGERAPQITLRNVGFYYPSRADVKVLDNIALSIAPGETVAIIGPSGSGKTTLLELLLKLYRPSEGEISVDGTPLAEIPFEEWMGEVSYLEQFPLLFSGTILENIQCARPGATEEEVKAAAKMAKIHDFITGLPDGYRTDLGEMGEYLSIGQRQRIALARSFLRDAPLVLMDEPMSALDPATVSELIDIFSTLLKGKTAIIVTHNYRLLSLADRVFWLESGKLFPYSSK